jgi:hypothetical protein
MEELDMRHLLAALAVISGLTTATILVATVPARAAPLGQAFLLCDIGAVKVSGSFEVRHYEFERICGGQREAKVESAYDVATGKASEKVAALNGEWTFWSIWTCSDDPWISTNPFSCGSSKIQTTGELDAYSKWRVDMPLSAGLLSARSRHVLDKQLQNAMNAQAAAKQPAGPLIAPDSPFKRRVPSGDAKAALTGKVTDDVDLYDAPDGNTGKVVGVLRRGQTVTLVATCRKDDWCQIARPQGWAWGEFID